VSFHNLFVGLVSRDGRGHHDADSSCNDNVEDVTNGTNENAGDGVQPVQNPVMSESVEEVSDFPLEHCMRIVPHDQNTGAFFIAVLQKVSPLPPLLTPHVPAASKPRENDVATFTAVG